MGCTSSAPNMAPSQTNSENNVKLSEEKDKESIKQANEVIHEKENETISIKVLPTCDNFAETTQLARNNKSFVDTTNLVLDKDYHGNGHVMDGDNVIISNVSKTSEASSETEEKLSKLEEVVEKVVEMFTSDKESPSENFKTEPKDVVETNAQDNDTENETQSPKKQDEMEHSEEKEEFEETVSPSQSQSSRATRWEALADIAAELPPSLAVDPITGQIYALSK